MTADRLAASVLVRWRAGQDSHAIAVALQLHEQDVVSIVNAERTDRLRAQNWRPLAAIRPRRWP